jgi:hypothetical protein
VPQTAFHRFGSYLLWQHKKLSYDQLIVAEYILTIEGCSTEHLVELIDILYPRCIKERGGPIPSDTIDELIDILKDAGFITIDSKGTFQLSKTAPAVTASCVATHAKLIAGTCPWCGCSVLNHK